MTNKSKKKDYLKIFLLAVTIIVTYSICSDWSHFKDGLLGGIGL
jgi:hypothetical protein